METIYKLINPNGEVYHGAIFAIPGICLMLICFTLFIEEIITERKRK